MSNNSISKIKSIFSFNTCKNDIPNLTGTYIQKYKILKVENSEQLEDKELTKEFFDNYFKNSNLFVESSKNDNEKIIIKQNENDKRYAIVYESELKDSAIRSYKGIRPGIIRKIGDCLWELINPDYDDNGVFSIRFKVNKNGEVYNMIGNYYEAGYSESNPLLQKPTVGIINYEKISDSIEIKENIKNRNLTLDKLLPRLKKNYKFKKSILNKNKIITRNVKEKYGLNFNLTAGPDGISTITISSGYLIDEKTNTKKNEKIIPDTEIKYYYQKFLFKENFINNSKLNEINQLLNKKFQYGIIFNGPLFNEEFDKIQGEIQFTTFYSVFDGKISLFTENIYYILDQKDEITVNEIFDTNFKNSKYYGFSISDNIDISVAFKTSFNADPKIRNNRFVLGNWKSTGNDLV